ncbi:MAG TPA: glycosyltransferase family 2 protein [Solirubrobacterales bacterium]|nr:glycosyltransferase family 2 protein [Solirubrobacterales bacterium]
MRATYVLPIRWHDDEELDDLTAYLRGLPDWLELIVVDGSPDPLFERHGERWGSLGRHLPPDPALETPMGKVGGVLTGLREASSERIVIADDDVRYDPASLRRTVTLLGIADCVQPQNYFSSLSWHARWDTGRTLLNRGMGGDFAGTLAVRRTALTEAGGYDGDVIFENLELMRTIRALGGTLLSPLDLYVARRPPSAPQFLSQRVRQAYDDLAIPPRMAVWLASIPALSASLLRGSWRTPLLAAAAIAALAEVGRRRAGGRRYFPASSSLLAPLWVLERGVCAWIAVRDRLLLGGVPYGDELIPRSASSMRRLRRRLAARRPEPDQLVGPVAERLPPRRAAAA